MGQCDGFSIIVALCRAVMEEERVAKVVCSSLNDGFQFVTPDKFSIVLNLRGGAAIGLS